MPGLVRFGLGLDGRLESVLGDRVEAAPRPAVVGRDLGVFPRARHESHLLEPRQRAVQRAMSGEAARVR